MERRRFWLGTTAVSVVFACATFADARAQTPQSPGSPPPAIELPPMSVEGQSQGSSDYKVDQPSLPKLTQPLRDTPQTITTIPRQVMQDQGVTTLRDALRNVSGLSINAGEASRQGDSISIRGFTASTDFYIDGMNDFGSYYRDPFNTDQVEVLTGPSSVLFGRGSTGGVVNQVSKSPFLDNYRSGSITFGTNLTKRLTADVNTPIDGLGPGAAFRINVMGHDNEFTYRDDAENSRFGIAPSLSFGLGTDTRTTLSYLHQTEYDMPDYGVPWLDVSGSHIARPAPVSWENFYGFDSNDFLRTNVDVVTGKIEHDINDSLTLRSQLRYANYLRDFRITEPQVTTVVSAATPFSQISVNRNILAGQSAETYLEDQTDMTSRFSTGFVDHTLVTGIAIGRQTSDPTRFTFTGVPGTNLATPDPDQPFSATTSRISSQVGATAYTQAAYLVDTLKLAPQLDLLGAIRYDRFDAHVHQNVTNVTSTNNQVAGSFSRVDEKPSWRGAIVYKPEEHGSIYVQYGTSFNPSAESLALASNTVSLSPEESETYEAGSKWDVLHERLSLAGSIFQITKTNARETDPNNALNQINAGTIRVEGFSLSGVGRVTDQWQVFTGYTYLDAVVVSSPAKDAGNRPASTPRNTYNLWSTYELTQRWQVGGGINYVSSRYASSLNDANGERRETPSYWTGQAMVKYRVTDAVNVQLNGYNLANKLYYEQIHPSHVIPAEGRTFLLSTNFVF